MRSERCSQCFRRVDFIEAHVCATAPTPRLKREASAPSARYERPSRPRVPRDDYLASVASTPEQKLALRRAKQARYRARQKEAAASV